MSEAEDIAEAFFFVACARVCMCACVFECRQGRWRFKCDTPWSMFAQNTGTRPLKKISER